MVLDRLRYTINTLKNALDEYEDEALPNTRVMSNISRSGALIRSVEVELRNRL